MPVCIASTVVYEKVSVLDMFKKKSESCNRFFQLIVVYLTHKPRFTFQPLPEARLYKVSGPSLSKWKVNLATNE